MKTILKEQVSQTKIDLIQGRDVYKCPFLLGAESGPPINGKQIMRRTATVDSPKGNYVKGDYLYIKNDYTFDVIRDNKIVKSNLKWVCSTLNNDVVQPQLSADQMKSVNDLIAKYPGMYQKETPTADQLKTGEWKPINLKDKFPEQFKFDYTIYEKGGLRQSKSPQQEKIIATYVNKGWRDLGGKINPAEIDKYNTLDLKDDYKDDFPESYLLVQPIESTDTNQLFQEMTAFVLSKNFGDRKACKKGINTYFTLWKKDENEQIPVDKATLKNWKLAINSCDAKVKNFNDFNITNSKLEKMKADSSRTLSLGKPTDTPTQTITPEKDTSPQNEEHNNLKSLVRENLIEVAKNKKRMLTEEKSIVNTRFNLLTENVNVKSKKSREKFCDDLLNEMIYLNRQGFSQEVISEGFFDIIKGLFGNTGESISQMFKQKMIEWLLDKFAPEGFKNTWFGGIIVNTLSNTPIIEIPKLMECGYLTKALSKGIVEELPKQLQHKSGTEGAFYDILRNSIVETLEDSNLGQKIESGLVNIICPLLSGVKGKMEDVGSAMKEKALATS